MRDGLGRRRGLARLLRGSFERRGGEEEEEMGRGVEVGRGGREGGVGREAVPVKLSVLVSGYSSRKERARMRSVVGRLRIVDRNSTFALRPLPRPSPNQSRTPTMLLRASPLARAAFRSTPLLRSLASTSAPQPDLQPHVHSLPVNGFVGAIGNTPLVRSSRP